jgi:hypothetical protein
MVALYASGKKIGDLADLERLLPEIRANGKNVEILDENGNSMARILPLADRDPKEPLVPWDPSITREELDRRAAEPGLTFDEVRKRLGWE